jgi:hypothetical protein
MTNSAFNPVEQVFDAEKEFGKGLHSKKSRPARSADSGRRHERVESDVAP